MRLVAGLIGFHALLLLAGLAFLYAAGLIELRLARIAAGLGAAHLAGIAMTGLPLIFALTVGVSIGAPAFVVAALVTTAVAAVAAALWRARRRPSGGDRRGLDLGGAIGPAGAGLAAVIGLFVVLQAIASADTPTAWDAAHIWTLKTVALAYHGELVPSIFTSLSFGGSHLDYPLLQPVFNSMAMRFAGTHSQGLAIVELWLILGATVAAAAFLVGERSRLWLVLLPLGVLVASATSSDIVRGDADLTMACFLAIGALGIARWLEARQLGFLALAILMLGASANIKNEGLVFSIVVMVVALVAAFHASRRSGLTLVGGGAVLAALILPWRLWVHANGPFPSDVTPLHRALHPHFLADRTDQLRTGLHFIAQRLDQQGGWLVPAFVVLCVAVLWLQPLRCLGGFYLAAGLGTLVPVLFVYWISTQPDVPAHIQRTSEREVTGPIFLATVALAHLLARLGPGERGWPGFRRRARSAPGGRAPSSD